MQSTLGIQFHQIWWESKECGSDAAGDFSQLLLQENISAKECVGTEKSLLWTECRRAPEECGSSGGYNERESTHCPLVEDAPPVSSVPPDCRRRYLTPAAPLHLDDERYNWRDGGERKTDKKNSKI